MPHDSPQPVGRDRLIADLVARAREGNGTVLIGPPGSGRSTILTSAAGALGHSGLRGVHIVVTPSIAAAPFGVYVPLLGRAALDRITAAEAPPPMVALRAAVADLHLQALVIDGAPSLDPSAATLMLDVASSGVAVLVAAASEDEAFGAITALSTSGRATTVQVPPLSICEIRAIAEEVLGGHIDTELATALEVASGGLPGPLLETVQRAADTRAIVRTDGPWRLSTPLPVAPSLRSQVAERFVGLAPEQRGWIAAVAVSGAIADDLGCRIARRDTCDAAERTGWTRHDAVTRTTRMRIATDAAAVVDSLDARARRSVLQRLIAAADAAGRPLDDAERVAVAGWRLELGERPEAQEALVLAGLAGAGGVAREQLLRAAIEGGAPAHAVLADHLRRARRTDEATAVLDAAGAGQSTAERVELARVRAVTTGLVERRSDVALAALDAHIAEHGSHPDLVAVQAGLQLFEGRPEEALATAGTVLGDSGYAGLFALGHAVVSLKELGHSDAGAAMAERFGASGAGSGPAFLEGPGLAEYLLLDYRFSVSLELDAAESALLVVHERAVAGGNAAAVPPSSHTLGRIRLLRGDPLGAVRWFRDADAGSGAWRDSCLPRVVSGLAEALTLAGDLESAAEAEARLRRLVVPPLHRGRVGLALAQLAAARGDPRLAVQTAAAVWSDASGSGMALDRFDAAYAGIRFGDPTAALRLLELGTRPAGVGREAQREHARAVRDGDAAAIGVAAVGLWSVGLTLYAVEAAAAAADAGDTVAATLLVVWVARTPGLRVIGTTERRAGVLTSREREVAVLAARGLSDREVAAELGIALRTAQTHLTRAFAKLGVHRRTDLTDLLT